MNKEITIRCTLNSSLNNSQYQVIVLDDGKVISEGYTENGLYKFCITEPKIYAVQIIPNSNIYPKFLVGAINTIKNNDFCFCFNSYFYNEPSAEITPITVILIDQNYSGLRIERSILTWNNTQ